MASQRLGFMDGLRGIAVLMVLLYHGHTTGNLLPASLALPGMTIDLPLSVLNGGMLGVTLFFFISGFVLFYPYARHLFEGRPLQTLGHYIERRVAKIVPSYVLVLVVMTIVFPMEVKPPDSLAVHFVKHLFFLHGFWDGTFTSVIGALWTLAVEVEFYVCFPLIAWFFMRAPFVTMGVMIAISVGYHAYLDVTGLSYTFFWTGQLPDFLDVFGFGCLAAHTMVRARTLTEGNARSAFVWTAAACCGMLVFYGLMGSLIRAPGGPYTYRWLSDTRDVMGLTLYLMCVGIAQGSSLPRDVLGNSVFLWFSDISYNIYLWNENVLHLYLDHVSRWVTPLPYGETLNALLALALPVGIAWVVTGWVEKPILRKGLAGFFRRRGMSAKEPAAIA